MKSIRQQLIASLLLSLCIVVVISGALLYALVKQSLTRDFDSALLAKARALSALVMREPAGTVEIEFSDEMMPAFARPERPDYFEFWYEDGRPFARSRSLGSRDLPRPAHLVNNHLLSELVLPDGQRGRAAVLIFTPAKDPDDFAWLPAAAAMAVRPAPRMILMVAQHRSALDQTLRHMFWLIAAAGVFLPSIIALVVWLTVKQGLRPLNRLAQDTEAIDSQNLGHRFDADRMPRELQPIGHRLNALVERLETSFKQIQAAYQRERRFSDNVAHELRTPIAELHSLAEVALLFPHNRELDQKAHHETLAIARQMQDLVSVLLALARCEAGIEIPDLGPVNLDELVREVWTAHQDCAARRRITCQCELESGIVVNTNQLLLRSILNNLIANAVDHSPDGAPISIRVISHHGQARMTIENANETLCPEDLDLIFEPFWQKDASRTGAGHHGLGLSLVQSMCRALNIDFTIEISDDQQVIVELYLGESQDLFRTRPISKMSNGNSPS